jgi:hypothetical protein
MQKKWKKWFNEQSTEYKIKAAISAIERLIEIEEVCFREKDSHDPDLKEFLYWESCGEELLK